MEHLVEKSLVKDSSILQTLNTPKKTGTKKSTEIGTDYE